MPWRYLVGVDAQLCLFITLGLEVSCKLHPLATGILRKIPSTLWIAGWVWMFWRRRGSLASAGVWTLYHPVCDLHTILTTLSSLLMIVLWVIASSLLIRRLLKTGFAFCYLNCGLKVCGTMMKTELLETYVIILQLTKWDVIHYQKCHCILLFWSTDQYANEVNYWKPFAESAIETNSNWYKFILCFKYALLVLVSAIAFLTGRVHLLFTKLWMWCTSVLFIC